MADFNKFGRHLMAGKSKKAAKVDEHGTLIVAPPKTASNKEHLQRLNYLFHLSTFHTIANDQDENNALARMYAKNLDLIQKKTKSSLTPGLKRRLCKTCQRTLIPNKTMSPRVINESKRKKPVNRVLVLDCVCGRSKRFPIGKNPSYKAHAEKGSNLTFFQK
ncbi:LAQU0S04e03796g1_1 [Lachancea quebecensis]|uniref:LAQU0S04e03796g1_1 n=1 Tax=Lachancea quebecensis TaxID=1654605 RepID=A0A0P1KQG3_9SACH|nr:LAQU0S04e03796g1_1 [Lachancea quebecensis]